LVGDVQPYRQEIERADFVVAAEPGVVEFAEQHPSTKLLATTLAMVRGNDAFQLVRTVASRSGKSFYVFERGPAFGGWTASDNLDVIEGPYPQWNLPRVRWGLFPATALVVDAPAAGRFTLTASARAPMDDQTISVFVDGQPIGQEKLGPRDTFMDIRLPMDLAAGEHRIELRFEKWEQADAPDSRQRTVLFERLRMDAPDGA